jgi:hypothetical protein
MAVSHVVGTTDVTHIKAPVTIRAYLLCGFVALGGILFGFDSGFVSGILDMPFLIHLYTGILIPGPDASAVDKANFKLPLWQDSLIISIHHINSFGRNLLRCLDSWRDGRFVRSPNDHHHGWASFI